jgi:hypothetical protein
LIVAQITQLPIASTRRPSRYRALPDLTGDRRLVGILKGGRKVRGVNFRLGNKGAADVDLRACAASV